MLKYGKLAFEGIQHGRRYCLDVYNGPSPGHHAEDEQRVLPITIIGLLRGAVSATALRVAFVFSCHVTPCRNCFPSEKVLVWLPQTRSV